MPEATLLLLHAFPFDARMWEGVRGRFVERGRTMLSPSLPLAPERRGMADWAEDVLGLASDPVIPVGVSLGGYLAFELWRRAPQRIPALVLADTRATAEPPEGRLARERAIETIREGGPEALWLTMEDRLLRPAAPREVRERARELVLDRDPTTLVATVEAIRDRPDSTATVPTISAPTLVLVGEEDAIVPLAEAAALANALPTGRLRAIPQAGHVPPLEQPEAFAALVLAFLQDVAA
jgi:pimeloyl-ACP methyl ester carboxylesterase